MCARVRSRAIAGPRAGNSRIFAFDVRRDPVSLWA